MTPRALRLLALLPLLFFILRVVEYAVVAGTPEQILWCCHISNLMLAAGLALGSPPLIRVACLWLLLGLPPWIIDMIRTGLITPVSILTHLGGAIVSVVAVKTIGARRGSWLHALVFFLGLQQLTRLLTVPGHYTNVNVAHFAYGPWKDLIPQYPVYLLVNSLVAALALWLVERMLLWWAPEKMSGKRS